MAVALVCGGGGALGTAVVEALVARGDSVVAVDRHPRDAAEGVRFEALDLTSADEVDTLWERLVAAGETPRFVVNVTGGYRSGTVLDSDPDSLRFMTDLNLGTTWWSCRAAARHLPDGGAIVNVGSRTAVSGGAGAAAYAVTKAGVVRLTEVLSAELAERRVRVNAILPSTIDTQANRDALSPEALKKAVSAAEIAGVVAFLLSDAAAAVTGAIVPVYGFA
jgi:NAD(P)-dependent dehydrogenase (short-subunit alcohol dehydrogenase family)